MTHSNVPSPIEHFQALLRLARLEGTAAAVAGIPATEVPIRLAGQVRRSWVDGHHLAINAQVTRPIPRSTAPTDAGTEQPLLDLRHHMRIACRPADLDHVCIGNRYPIAMRENGNDDGLCLAMQIPTDRLNEEHAFVWLRSTRGLTPRQVGAALAAQAEVVDIVTPGLVNRHEIIIAVDLPQPSGVQYR